MTNLLALQICTCLLLWQPIFWPKCTLPVEIKMAVMWLCKWLYDLRASLKLEAMFYQCSWRKSKSQNHALGPSSLSLLPLPSFLSFSYIYPECSYTQCRLYQPHSSAHWKPSYTFVIVIDTYSQVNYSFIYKISGVSLSVVSFVLCLRSLESKFRLKTNTRCSFLIFYFEYNWLIACEDLHEQESGSQSHCQHPHWFHSSPERRLREEQMVPSCMKHFPSNPVSASFVLSLLGSLLQQLCWQ